MAKILLVEDDSNLREIYGARLEAEGYEIVAASDGEEALAMAVRELPDLIISDVMMPKISGFDMLDILRTTPETKDVKVIVMTALSQEEDRQRGESLGADKYIVKSQVTLDDVVSMVQELLASTPGTPTALQNDSSILQPVMNDPLATQASNPSSQPTVNDPLASQTAAAVTGQVPVQVPVSDPTPASPTDGATLDDEVQQFVQTSPLMNGTAPTPPQSPVQAVKDDSTQTHSEPVQPPQSQTPVA